MRNEEREQQRKKRKETYSNVSLFVVGSDGFEPPKA